MPPNSPSSRMNGHEDPDDENISRDSSSKKTFEGLNTSDEATLRVYKQGSMSSVIIDPTWSPSRQAASHVVNHWFFDWFVCVTIVLNFVAVILDTNARAAGERVHEKIWSIVLIFFLLIYAGESCLRFFALRQKFFRDKWNLMDMFIIVSDGVLVTMQEIVETPSTGILRIMKVLRFMRFLRAVRTMSVFRELYILLHGFLSAMKALFWCTILLVFMMGMWGIIAVEVLHDLNEQVDHGSCERCSRAFASVEHAFLTFTQTILAGDSWGMYAVPLIEEQPMTIVLFLFVLITINLGMLNLILTAIVDRAAQARADDKRMRLQDREQEFMKAKKELMSLCADIDEDHSGFLSKDELLKGFDDQQEFADVMRLMDVQREDLTMLFTILDEDGSGTVSYSEFVEQLHRMKSQDTQMLLVFIRSYVKDVKNTVQKSLQLTESLQEMVYKHTVEQSAQVKFLTEKIATALKEQPSTQSQDSSLGASVPNGESLSKSGEQVGNTLLQELTCTCNKILQELTCNSTHAARLASKDLTVTHSGTAFPVNLDNPFLLEHNDIDRDRRSGRAQPRERNLPASQVGPCQALRMASSNAGNASNASKRCLSSEGMIPIASMPRPTPVASQAVGPPFD